jgi:hypothetical protein
MKMDKEFIAELVEKLENAKTAAEVSNILNMGDADVQKLTVDDLDGISGGGHYANLPKGQKIWVSLVDQNYASVNYAVFEAVFDPTYELHYRPSNLREEYEGSNIEYCVMKVKP